MMVIRACFCHAWLPTGRLLLCYGFVIHKNSKIALQSILVVAFIQHFAFHSGLSGAAAGT